MPEAIEEADNAGPSLPTRGAWIEIAAKDTQVESLARRSPHGERGLKFIILA